MFNGVNENPAPVDDETNTTEEAQFEDGAEGGEETESSDAITDDNSADNNSDEKSSSKKPARAKGKKTMTTKGKKAAKSSKPAAKKASKPAKTAKTAKKKANGNGARPDSKMSQAVAFMKAERAKLDDPKAPPRGFRKELIERTAKKFGLAVATCSTQYGAKVGA